MAKVACLPSSMPKITKNDQNGCAGTGVGIRKTHSQYWHTSTKFSHHLRDFTRQVRLFHAPSPVRNFSGTFFEFLRGIHGQKLISPVRFIFSGVIHGAYICTYGWLIFLEKKWCFHFWAKICLHHLSCIPLVELWKESFPSVRNIQALRPTDISNALHESSLAPVVTFGYHLSKKGRDIPALRWCSWQLWSRAAFHQPR